MISRFPSLFFYQSFLSIAVFLSFEMLSFLQMFLVSYLELQLITHDMNEIVLSVRSVWLHLISGIHLFLRGLSLSLS